MKQAKGARLWDLVAGLLVLGLIVFLAETSRELMEPLAELQRSPLTLDPAHLPEYAARSTLRMLAALGLSLLFTFTYATFAAEQTLHAVTSWGRYAEAFAYDDHAQVFSLENPS
jgi:NitT/TauT family transport system permease protein